MDELLGRVEEGRRGFLKKLLGGAFAAPVLASFSMDGLTVTPADAQVFIKNQTEFCRVLVSNAPDCCARAAVIVVQITCLIADTQAAINFGTLRGASARKASAVKSLQKALEFMNEGIEEGAGDCTTTKARSKFTYAHGWMINYVEILADLDGPAKADLLAHAQAIIDLIDDLLACSAP